LHKVTIKPLAGKLEFHFSHTFQGVVWNMILVPQKSILIVEVRDEERRQVSFSALDFSQNKFLWKDVRANESWWVNLYQANEREVILSKFENTNNPDSVTYLSLDLQTANIQEKSSIEKFIMESAEVLIPVQYLQGSPYFETVKKFVEQKLDSQPVHSIEYLENSDLIFISMYTQLESMMENWILVFNMSGELLLREKMGTALKGLGLETFFIWGGYLFFVKNKMELATYVIQ